MSVLKSPLAILARIGLVLVVLPVLGLYLILLGCQSKLIYFPRPYPKTLIEDVAALGLRALSFETGEGQQTAFYLPPMDVPERSSEPEEMWLITAGNGSVALDFLEYAATWQAEGGRRTSFLFVDYPGYGNCEGKATPSTISENLAGALAARNALPDLPPTRIACLGHSLGAAAALIAADELGAERVIIVSAFTSMGDMVGQQMGSWARPVLRHRYDNRTHLSNIAARDVPVLAFHGKDDRMIPAAMSRSLAEEFPETVTLRIVENAGHNNVIGVIREELGEEIARGHQPPG